ncbi:MAG TPA: hypothetical protein VIS94_09250 [Desulfomonilia bacterium]
MWKYVVIAFVVLIGFFSWCSQRTLHHAPGIIAPDIPVQETINDADPFTYKDYTIKPVAAFKLKARVLSRERYRFDRCAELSPVDLALGWGPMSDEAVLNKLKISQMGRFFYWKASGVLPIPLEQICANASNMHMIPANKYARRILLKVRPGQIIEIEGYLVNVSGRDGMTWQTSLSRTDTGRGACELVWVEKANIR